MHIGRFYDILNIILKQYEDTVSQNSKMKREV